MFLAGLHRTTVLILWVHPDGARTFGGFEGNSVAIAMFTSGSRGTWLELRHELSH